MNQTMNFPARYAPLTDEEMTYTEGGALSALELLQGTATVVGALVLGSSLIWGVTQASNWLSDPRNHKANIFATIAYAVDSIGNDMSNSPANFLRDTVAIGTIVGAIAFPVGAIISYSKSHVY